MAHRLADQRRRLPPAGFQSAQVRTPNTTPRLIQFPGDLRVTAVILRVRSSMPESDPLQILLDHDRWATGRVLDACAKLPAEQFHQRFDIGPGSLHDTLTHVVGAMRTWTDTLAGTDPRPRLETDG